MYQSKADIRSLHWVFSDSGFKAKHFFYRNSWKSIIIVLLDLIFPTKSQLNFALLNKTLQLSLDLFRNSESSNRFNWSLLLRSELLYVTFFIADLEFRIGASLLKLRTLETLCLLLCLLCLYWICLIFGLEISLVGAWCDPIFILKGRRAYLLGFDLQRLGFLFFLLYFFKMETLLLRLAKTSLLVLFLLFRGYYWNIMFILDSVIANLIRGLYSIFWSIRINRFSRFYDKVCLFGCGKHFYGFQKWVFINLPIFIPTSSW